MEGDATIQTTFDDMVLDHFANPVGRNAGTQGLSCPVASDGFRPDALDGRY